MLTLILLEMKEKRNPIGVHRNEQSLEKKGAASDCKCESTTLQ